MSGATLHYSTVSHIQGVALKLSQHNNRKCSEVRGHFLHQILLRSLHKVNCFMLYLLSTVRQNY